MVPAGARRPRGAPSGGAVAFIKSFYQDEFKWSVVKSTGLFVLGVYIARELRGVDLIGAGGP